MFILSASGVHTFHDELYAFARVYRSLLVVLTVTSRAFSPVAVTWLMSAYILLYTLLTTVYDRKRIKVAQFLTLPFPHVHSHILNNFLSFFHVY